MTNLLGSRRASASDASDAWRFRKKMKQAEFLWISCKNVDSLNFHCSSKVDRTQADCTWKDVERYGKQSGVVCSGLLLSFLFTFAPFPVASVVVYWLLLCPLILNSLFHPCPMPLFRSFHVLPCKLLREPSFTFLSSNQLAKPQGTANYSEEDRSRSKHMRIYTLHSQHVCCYSPPCQLSAEISYLSDLSLPAFPTDPRQKFFGAARQEKQRRPHERDLPMSYKDRANIPHSPQKFHLTYMRHFREVWHNATSSCWSFAPLRLLIFFSLGFRFLLFFAVCFLASPQVGGADQGQGVVSDEFPSLPGPRKHTKEAIYWICIAQNYCTGMKCHERS